MASARVATDEPGTLAGVLVWLVCHPWQSLVRRWNYKSALLSASIRLLLFLATNLRAGLEAATAAMLTEALFRLGTSGFYGAITQAFRRAEPRGPATLCALVILPVVSHGLELLVHWWRGTPELVASVLASVALTVVSTAFNLYAMRRGALVVGATSASLLADLRALPRLLIQFTAMVGRSCVRACL